MKKLAVLLLVIVMCAGVLASCSASETPTSTPTPTIESTPTPDATPDETPEPSGSVSFTDSAGRTVEIPAGLSRISPSGSLAQMFLLALAPDMLVTLTSEYMDEQAVYIPDYVTTLPLVGHFYGTADINLEAIASVNPEIVIDVGEPKKSVVEDMDEITANTAIPAVHITATLESTPEAFRTLGKLLGREEKGEQLAQFCEMILAQTNDILAKVGDSRVKALYLTGDTGQNVIAANSYHSEIFDYLVDNIAVVDNPSSKGSGNETDLEQLSIWNPEFIVFSPNSAYASAADDPAWSQLDAIASGNYVETPFGPYNWFGNPPSINRYLLLIWLPTVIYPDYVEYELYEQVKEYYNLFYGHELSVVQFDELTANAFIK